jgi:hypothetical protein
MIRYRHQLPLGSGPLLSDGGLETTLVFHEAQLPVLRHVVDPIITRFHPALHAAAPTTRNPTARAALASWSS